VKTVFRTMAIVFVLASVSACTTYPGDRILQLYDQSNAYDEGKIISTARVGVADILSSLTISEDTKNSLGKIAPIAVIREIKPLDLAFADNQLVVAKGDANISFASNSIIIVNGILNIAHSSNNIIVCGSDVDISHDGSMGEGSLVISKGKTTISHAGNTIIYAIKGTEISHARNVKAFNTSERKTSWGHINNILVKPLFEDEASPSKSP